MRTIDANTLDMRISAEQRLKELGIKLPAPPEPFGTYVMVFATLASPQLLAQAQGKERPMEHPTFCRSKQSTSSMRVISRSMPQQIRLRSLSGAS